jgi:FkbM family methyltransferase
MRYDYVDIGTCDFDTSAEVALTTEQVLLVEPVLYYLDRILDKPNIQKANLAISNNTGQLTVYHLPDVTIHLFDLPNWARGCNSVGTRHPTVDRLLLDRGLPLNLVNQTQVEVLTFKELCSRYKITEIGKLKIDTEGHEQYIIPGVLEQVQSGMLIKEIKFENQVELGNKMFLDSLAKAFVDLGDYEISEVTAMDTVLTRI